MTSSPAAQNRPLYRADIDGLRAVAVLAVIAYHAWPSLVPGGFAGVDVFFVLSGYLISSIILRGIQNKTFRFRDFYNRRIRRIFPALIVVFMCSLIIGYGILLADEYAMLGKHVASGSIFLSNFTLLNEAGYFDVNAELKPFLHLWSLGIEEQFYIFWPLLLVLASRFHLRLFWFVLCIAILSFGANVWRVDAHLVQTFYNPFTRFWELMAGALLASSSFLSALMLSVPKKRLRNVMSFLGLSLILLSFMLVNKNDIYPGWWATLPVLGTVLVVGAGATAWLNTKVLSVRSLVFVGLISYPLYLWHWPLLSFVRIVESGHPPLFLECLSVAVAFVLAWGTYRYVESFLRHNPSSWVLPGLLGTMAILGITGKYIEVEKGLPARSSVAHYQDFDRQMIREAATDKNCEQYVLTQGEKKEFYYCRARNLEKEKWLAIVGDSHAHVLFPGFAEQAAARGYGAILLANTSCPPLVGAATGKTDTERSQCADKIEQILRLVEREAKIHKVVFVTRGPVYISGQEFGVRSRKRQIFFTSVEDESLPPNDVFFVSLQNTVDRLISVGKSVFLFLENPEMGVKPGDCNRRPFAFTHIRPKFQVSYKQYAARMGHYRQQMEKLFAHNPGLVLLDPEPLFCSKTTCFGIRNGQLLYSDDDHLSVAGSKYVASELSSLVFKK